jgi:hypothetical protein
MIIIKEPVLQPNNSMFIEKVLRFALTNDSIGLCPGIGSIAASEKAARCAKDCESRPDRQPGPQFAFEPDSSLAVHDIALLGRGVSWVFRL